MAINPDIADDRELMLCFQKGDESCFEELVNRHKQRVLNLVYRFLGGRDDAEDIAQDIFVKIYKSRDNYKPSARFTTWLYVICRNTCFKVISKKKLPLLSLDGADESESMMIAQIPDTHNASPADDVVYDELALVVKAAVESLPDGQRMAFILSRYEQLSYVEIAEVMDYSVEAIKSLLHRAKVNLKKYMTDYL